MLGIEFLNRPNDLQVDGLEFMDYQKGDLFKDLVDLFDQTVVQEGPNWIFNRDENKVEKLEELIMTHTGINMSLKSEQVSNVAVDAGFINPGNILNIKGIDDFFAAKDSSIGQAFRRLKTDVLKGTIDTSTGKVGGDYSKVEFGLYVNNQINGFIRHKFLARYNVTMSQALAVSVLHECGHVFTGFMYVHRGIIDPIISTTAIKLIVEGKKYGKERADVVREAFKVMDIGQKVDEEAIADFTGDEFVVYFNKAVGTRDTRRTLSLGTQGRSSEIYADLYAVRMGCPKSMVAAITALSNDNTFYALTVLQSMACIVTGLLACSPVVIAAGALNGIFMTLSYLNSFLSPNDNYDTSYRRIKTILRDYVIRINNLKDLDKKAKARMLADAKEIEQIVDDAKPFLEGTWVQRTVGYIFNGSDFRAQEFEHYTDELLGHTLSLYKEAI